MCGIVGHVEFDIRHSEMFSRISDMLAPIYHRGPDDFGIWVDEGMGVGIGHRRLSIVELSAAGHQPMSSACKRFVIAFNGEIYNHLDLRMRLESVNSAPIGGWRGHSDTETLLACFATWGVEKTLQATVGMFALALWDRQENILTLARDRIGEKPLYYGWQNRAFLFCSELKSLRKNPAFRGEKDWNAASSFLHLNYVPAPYSIYKGIFKLRPGTFLQLTKSDMSHQVIPQPVCYWSLMDSVRHGEKNPFNGCYEDAVNELEVLVRNAVHLQGMADVPVGAFLSGGIDSSTVVAMMQLNNRENVTTFSIGMSNSHMDESRHAAAVARHLKTRHIEHIINPNEVLDLIPRLPEIWDEPFADSSQIPTFLVSQLAKNRVTVALSGDGGDEFFLGYSQYILYKKIWRSRILGKLPWNLVFSLQDFLGGRVSRIPVLRQARSIVGAWRQDNSQLLNRYWSDRYPSALVPLQEQIGVKTWDFPLLKDVASTAGLWDSGTYLPDDILVKVDRASMANSLETRAPLLDHRIVEFAFRLPTEYKVSGGVGKKILRDVLYRHVPKSIVDRPKMGFSIPISDWLRKDLHSWANEVICGISNDNENINKMMIMEIWREHLSGYRDHSERLWGILTLLSFME